MTLLIYLCRFLHLFPVADPLAPPPPSRSESQKQKKRPDLGRNMLQNALFEASDIILFRGSMPRAPLEHRRLAVECVIFFKKSAHAPPPPPRLSIPRSASGFIYKVNMGPSSILNILLLPSKI